MMKSKTGEKKPEKIPDQSEETLNDLDEIENILPFDPDPKSIPKYTPPQRISNFSQSDFGDALIEEYHIITVGGKLYLYDDCYYKLDTSRII